MFSTYSKNLQCELFFSRLISPSLPVEASMEIPLETEEKVYRINFGDQVQNLTNTARTESSFGEENLSRSTSGETTCSITRLCNYLEVKTASSPDREETHNLTKGNTTTGPWPHGGSQGSLQGPGTFSTYLV